MKLLGSSGKNKYIRVINYITIALNHTDLHFQESVLSSCLNIIKEIENSEKELLKKCIEDSPFLLATLFNKSLTPLQQENSFTKYLFDPSLIPKQKIPRDPILLGKTSKSITLQIPVFNPKVSIKLLLKNPSKQFLG